MRDKILDRRKNRIFRIAFTSFLVCYFFVHVETLFVVPVFDLVRADSGQAIGALGGFLTLISEFYKGTFLFLLPVTIAIPVGCHFLLRALQSRGRGWELFVPTAVCTGYLFAIGVFISDIAIHM